MGSPYKPGRPRKIKDPMRETAPHAPGEYRIKRSDGSMYIGQTNDLARRQKEHRRSGKITDDSEFSYQRADGRYGTRSLAEHERKKIRQHKPELNKSRGGEGRPMKKRRKR